MIRPYLLPVGMSTSNRIIKPGYEFYQPVIAARQVGLRKVPPHFFLHHLTTIRADLPDVITTQRCYSIFSDLLIPIPVDLSPLRPSTLRTGGRCGRLISSRKLWGRCCSRFTLSMKPQRKRYYHQFNVFLLTLLNSFSDSICSFCSRKIVWSLGTTMAPPSSFHQLPPWPFSAKMLLPRQRSSCRSNLAPRKHPPSGSKPLKLLPLKPKLR
jgi:hypothetical protein